MGIISQASTIAFFPLFLCEVSTVNLSFEKECIQRLKPFTLVPVSSA